MNAKKDTTWTRCRTAYNLVTVFAPMRKSHLMDALGLPWSRIDTTLRSMETHGFLVWEDEHGLLGPFENRAGHYLRNHGNGKATMANGD